MTKILTLDEMREVIHTFDPAEAQRLADQQRALANRAVRLICKRFRLHSPGASVEEAELCGTAAPFYKVSDSIPTPDAFVHYDSGEDIDVKPLTRIKKFEHQFPG